jgi:hypothetical protein
MRRRSALIVVAGAIALARMGNAQAVTLHGVAYDSLRNEPLRDALVAIVGRGQSTTTDARGRFEFDSVPPGTYTFTMQHAVLDSLGLSGVSTRLKITNGREEVRIAVPSFATFWHNACGPGRTPTDTGFVYGTVRDAASETPVANATIDATWVDLSADKVAGIRQRRYRSQTRSDAHGSFGICGVPAAVDVRVQASTDSASSGVIDLPPRDVRVQRRDLSIAKVSESDSTRRGVIAGMVTDGAGAPFPNARIVMDEVPEVRSGSDGRFVIRNVPAGTRQVEVLSVGMSPVVSTVDVIARDTAVLAAQLRKATTLDVVRVTASARQQQFFRAFDERRRSGLGYWLDSTMIAGRGTMSAVFGGFLSTQIRSDRTGRIRGIMVGTPPCTAVLWLDGVRQVDYAVLSDIYPEDLAAVEVYPHAAALPAELSTVRSNCGAVAVWTKRGIK